MAAPALQLLEQLLVASQAGQHDKTRALVQALRSAFERVVAERDEAVRVARESGGDEDDAIVVVERLEAEIESLKAAARGRKTPAGPDWVSVERDIAMWRSENEKLRQEIKRLEGVVARYRSDAESGSNQVQSLRRDHERAIQNAQAELEAVRQSQPSAESIQEREKHRLEEIAVLNELRAKLNEATAEAERWKREAQEQRTKRNEQSVSREQQMRELTDRQQADRARYGKEIADLHSELRRSAESHSASLSRLEARLKTAAAADANAAAAEFRVARANDAARIAELESLLAARKRDGDGSFHASPARPGAYNSIGGASVRSGGGESEFNAQLRRDLARQEQALRDVTRERDSLRVMTKTVRSGGGAESVLSVPNGSTRGVAASGGSHSDSSREQSFEKDGGSTRAHGHAHLQGIPSPNWETVSRILADDEVDESYDDHYNAAYADAYEAVNIPTVSRTSVRLLRGSHLRGARRPFSMSPAGAVYNKSRQSPGAGSFASGDESTRAGSPGGRVLSVFVMAHALASEPTGQIISTYNVEVRAGALLWDVRRSYDDFSLLRKRLGQGDAAVDALVFPEAPADEQSHRVVSARLEKWLRAAVSFGTGRGELDLFLDVAAHAGAASSGRATSTDAVSDEGLYA